MDNNINTNIPYIAHESEMSRLERIIKRLWLTVLVCIATFFITNFLWIWYINQYDFESYDISTSGGGDANYVNQDGNANYIDEDGDIIYGTNTSEKED